MQSVIDGWGEPVPAELIGRIAPTRIEGIHLRASSASRSSASPISGCRRQPHERHRYPLAEDPDASV
jgi:hypothetical protein